MCLGRYLLLQPLLLLSLLLLLLLLLLCLRGVVLCSWLPFAKGGRL